MISAPKIHPDLLWDMVILFAVLTLCYFLGVFFYRNKLTKKEKRILQRKRELSPMISAFIFYEEDASKDEKNSYLNMKIEIRELIKNDFNRAVLSEILLDLRKDISGDAQKSVQALYQDLGLHNDAFTKLKSWRWELVSKAILELTQMEVTEAYNFISKFINDKRATIRKQSEIAIVTLKHEGLNYFLDTTKHKISEWQQLKLIEVIRNRDDYQPPNFSAWLTSSNTYVVLFALRLIKYYNQSDAKTALIALIKHKNNQIKEEAIACIKEFYILEALTPLKAVFDQSSTGVKIAILDTIGALGTPTDIEFLNSIADKDVSFLVKSKAWSSINTIVPDTIMPTMGIQVDTTSNTGSAVTITTAIANLDNSEPIKINTTNSEDLLLEKDAELIETQSIELDFLPLVTGNSKKEKKMLSKKEVSKKLEHINVIYEEVKKIVKAPIIDINELSFLPIVTENEIVEPINEVVKIEMDSLSYEQYNVSNLYTIEVIHEELISETPIENIIVNDPFSFPQSIINEKENSIENLVSDDNNTITPDTENIFKTLLQNLVDFESTEEQHIEDGLTQQSPLLEFENEFIDVNAISHTESDPESASKTENNISELHIPKSILTDEPITTWYIPEENSEEATMQLLDDLEELGDYREISILEELTKSSSKSVVKRTKKLIARFSEDQSGMDFILSSSPDDALKPFNVFEDLFRSCDLEAKLILLDEAAVVGDEGDIEFLKSLSQSDELLLKEKAAHILEILREKLALAIQTKHLVSNDEGPTKPLDSDDENIAIDIIATPIAYRSLMDDLEIEPAQEANGVFDIDFGVEFDNEFKKNIDEASSSIRKSTNKQQTLIQQLCVFSNKIYAKLNG